MSDPTDDEETDQILKELQANVERNEVDISGVLADLKRKLDAEIGEATGDFKNAAKELKDRALKLGELAKEAGANTQEVKDSALTLKQELELFQNRFGRLGQGFGAMVKNGLNKFLPIPL